MNRREFKTKIKKVAQLKKIEIDDGLCEVCEILTNYQIIDLGNGDKAYYCYKHKRKFVDQDERFENERDNKLAFKE